MEKSHRRLLGPAILAILGTWACDVPTGVPRWSTTWVVPAESTTIAVSELLPAGVSVAPGGQAFNVSLDGRMFWRTLAELCGECGGFPMGAPVPAFAHSFEATVNMPADVVTAVVSGGTVTVVLQHYFVFDPLDPPGTDESGSLVIVLEAGGVTLARDSLDGATTTFAPGPPLVRHLALTSGEVSGPITVRVTLRTPGTGSQAVPWDLGDLFTVSVVGESVQVSEARVRVAGLSVQGAEVELDLDEVDEEIIDRVEGGGFRLEVRNPFELEGAIVLAVGGPGFGPIERTIGIEPGMSEARVTYNEDEIRSILGSPGVNFSASGTVAGTGAGGTVTVRPAQVLTIKAQLELVVGLGGED
jgi:hypothetical protein